MLLDINCAHHGKIPDLFENPRCQRHTLSPQNVQKNAGDSSLDTLKRTTRNTLETETQVKTAAESGVRQ